uniref:DUF834 domain-containing protein n=1 Tax=Oryza glumipatula TaxID=40148 RepID=A0A0D9ZZS4_9ORYZ
MAEEVMAQPATGLAAPSQLPTGLAVSAHVDGGPRRLQTAAWLGVDGRARRTAERGVDGRGERRGHRSHGRLNVAVGRTEGAPEPGRKGRCGEVVAAHGGFLLSS